LAKMVLAGLVCGSVCLGAADPPATGSIVIIDSAGKEQKVKEWAFTQRTRRLSWLAPAPKDEPGKEDKDNPPAPVRAKGRPTTGPEALEFREDNSTNFVDGVVTLVPLDRLHAIEYDDKDGVRVRVFLSPKADDDLTLKGTTKYKGINKIAI